MIYFSVLGIRIDLVGLDPDPGEQKGTNKWDKISCFEVLDVLFWDDLFQCVGIRTDLVGWIRIQESKKKPKKREKK
jgi:hypothetical protein